MVMLVREKSMLLALEEDAKRYRWLREQDWFSGEICCVVLPTQNLKLGSDCPSRERLDEFVDARRGK